MILRIEKLTMDKLITSETMPVQCRKVMWLDDIKKSARFLRQDLSSKSNSETGLILDEGDDDDDDDEDDERRLRRKRR